MFAYRFLTFQRLYCKYNFYAVLTEGRNNVLHSVRLSVRLSIRPSGASDSRSIHLICTVSEYHIKHKYM